MRFVLEICTEIFRTLWAHKLRSFLTMFGIAWGVGSLLLLVGLGEGFRSGNRRGLSEYGENIMTIFRQRRFWPAWTFEPSASSPARTARLLAPNRSTTESVSCLCWRDAGST